MELGVHGAAMKSSHPDRGTARSAFSDILAVSVFREPAKVGLKTTCVPWGHVCTRRCCGYDTVVIDRADLPEAV
jgi:hypothetical protein